jgi:hypothetical protein
VGNYQVTASFPGSPDYTSPVSAPADFGISPAAPTMQVIVHNSPGQPVAVTAMVAGVVGGVDDAPRPTLEGVGLSLQFSQVLPNNSLVSLTSVPTTTGNYQVVALFAGSAGYANTTNRPAFFTISQPGERAALRSRRDARRVTFFAQRSVASRPSCVFRCGCVAPLGRVVLAWRGHMTAFRLGLAVRLRPGRLPRNRLLKIPMRGSFAGEAAL